MRFAFWIWGGVLLGCSESHVSALEEDASLAARDATVIDSGVDAAKTIDTIAVREIDLGTGNVAIAVAAGGGHSCALLLGGAVKCWGNAYAGRLGSGQGYELIGDEPEELGDNLPVVDLGAGQSAVSVATGYAHSCAVLANHTLKCWGHAGFAQLGLGDRENRGDEPGEMGDALPIVSLGTNAAVELAALGGDHSCALLQGGDIKCWGTASSGRLGLGMPLEDKGDDASEMGDALPVVSLGGNATSLAVGGGHSCALLADGGLKCWGSAAFGQLGTEDTNDRGDELSEMGEALREIDLGRPVRAVAAGGSSTCALLDDGSVKCWGSNQSGQLGSNDDENRGDQAGEMGATLSALDLGGKKATALAVGSNHACALLDSGEVTCWGSRDALGLPAQSALESGSGSPRSYVVVPLRAKATRISAGGRHSCAVLEDGAVACWGSDG